MPSTSPLFPPQSFLSLVLCSLHIHSVSRPHQSDSRCISHISNRAFCVSCYLPGDQQCSHGRNFWTFLWARSLSCLHPLTSYQLDDTDNCCCYCCTGCRQFRVCYGHCLRGNVIPISSWMYSQVKTISHSNSVVRKVRGQPVNCGWH